MGVGARAMGALACALAFLMVATGPEVVRGAPSDGVCSSGESMVPTAGCKGFYQCSEGSVVGEVQCPAGTLFDVNYQYCNWADQVNCDGNSGSDNIVSLLLEPTTETETEAETEAVSESNPSIAATIAGSETDDVCSSGESMVPNEGCTGYYQCSPSGVLIVEVQCPDNLLFDVNFQYCNWPDQVTCDGKKGVDVEPEPIPIVEPSEPELPAAPEPSPEEGNSSEPSPGDVSIALEDLLNQVQSQQIGFDAVSRDGILVSEQPDGTWAKSEVYKLEDMMAAVEKMALIDVDGKSFYVGEDASEKEILYGRVNLAAFLSQAMQESIRYDVCDENNWDAINGAFPLSNSCGQLGQSYQDYDESPYKCAVDPSMSIKASTNAKWWGAPQPLACGPTSEYPSTGQWDPTASCPNGECTVYDGQLGGAVDDAPTSNQAGRTDVEGCCWWGRGAIQLTGVSNYGIMNHFMGKDSGVYPDVDFCANPEAVCSSTEHPELKWVSGLFYWVRSLQSFDQSGFNYMEELKKFVDDGMVLGGDPNFIQSTGCVVFRGQPGCSLHGGDNRAKNFENVLKLLVDTP